MSLANVLSKLVSKLTPEAIGLLVRLVRDALDSGQPPEDYLRRRLQAEGAHLAAQEAARRALDR